MIDYDETHWRGDPCPPINCRKKTCKSGPEYVNIPSALGDDSKDSPVAPKNGEYCNAIVKYEANKHVYIYSREGIPVKLGDDVAAAIAEHNSDENSHPYLIDLLSRETRERGLADETLQNEIDAIKNSPDVVDIVATKADLDAYDTSHLGDNDIIRVLADETHDGQSSYYRWDKSASTWEFIGTVGEYYTKTQVNTLLADKQDNLTAGANIQINNNVISATDTTYSAGDGIDIANTVISIETINSTDWSSIWQ